MANKNFKEILTKAGTTAAFAMAMTAALSIQASADEITEPPVEPPVEAPAVVEASNDVQEVSQHNETVESSNNETVQDNNDTVETNESTVSENDSAASGNDSTVSDNESAAADNDSTASGNDSNASDNDSTVSGNEGTAAGNDSTASGNGSVDTGNDSAVSDNDSTDSTNQETVNDNAGKIEGNEDLTTELPNAPEKPNAPEAPETPDLSEAPEAPETPDLPDVPNAPEVPETPDLPEVPDAPDAIETPDLDTENTDDYNDAVGDYNDKVDDYNGAAEDYNNGVGDYNDAADDYNDAVGDYNDAADDYNEALGNYNGSADEYNNAVDNYNGAVDSYNGAVGDANGKIDEYNQKVEDYNEKVDEYNGKVDEYNGAVDEINKELEAQFNKEHADWETDKETYDKALAAYKDYLIAEEKFKKEHAKWEIDHQIWQDKLDKHRETYGYENEEEYKALVAAYENAYGKWEDKCDELTNEYNAKKAVYDQLVAENQIYDDVLAYNKEVEGKNDGVEDLNDKLTSDLDTGAVENLEKAESNANVNAELEKTEEGKAMLETLSEENRKKLAAAESALAAEAAALDEEAKKDYQLGSEAYANYLARVKAFNAAIEAHNANLAAYNKAVEDYNKYVDDFNANNKPVEDSSSTDTEQNTAEADWGNINIENKILDHIDVKYQAASSKNVTEDEDGNKTYSDAVTGYTVTGVYTDENNTKNYGLIYDNDGSGTKHKEQTQGLQKNKGDKEFVHPNANGNSGAKMNPETGTVKFYVTLQDSNGETHGISVSLDATSTYADGSFYKPVDTKEDQFLGAFRDSNGNGLTKVDTNNDGVADSYNISGQSVFVISAMTCDGMGGNTQTGKQNRLNWTPDGLDLILNLQTMIKMHQADNAQKLIYQGGYLMGKTAYAETPEKPGTEPELKLPDPPKGPGDFVPFTDPEPQEPKLDPVKDPGEFTDPEPKLVQLEKLTYIEKLNPIENKVNPIENKLNPIEKLDTIENKLNPIEKLDTIDTLDKLDYKMILVIPEEIPEEEPVWFNDDVLIDEAIPLADGFVVLPDEEVPLADVPLTGDASFLFGMSSLFSLTGLYLTGKKRKQRD